MKKIIIIITVLGTIIFTAHPLLAEDQILPDTPSEQNASLFLRPDLGSLWEGDVTVFYLMLDPGNNTINAFQTGLDFDENKLELLHISETNPLCGLIHQEEAGPDKFMLTCANDKNLLNAPSPLFKVTFRKKAIGWTSINILDESAVLAHDGLGTNILMSKETHNILLR